MQNKNYILRLPQMNVAFNWRILDKELLLISGGRKPSIDWFKKVKLNRSLWCIDHGIDFCRENNFIPEFLIGDLDSANDVSVDWALNNSVKIERHPIDKDLTDTQLAINRVSEVKDVFAILTGIFGGRFDHIYSSVFSCANAKIKNCLIDEKEAVIFLHEGENLAIEFKSKPLALSLLPITPICRGVSLSGTHWPLSNATLSQKFPSAVSNRVESNVINISVDDGILAVYLYFDSML